MSERNRFLSHTRGVSRLRHIHFIGIGGAGMCGIAEILATEGYQISGSDLQENYATKRLSQLGVYIHIGHHPNHIKGADVVVRSSAVPDDNPEFARAKELGIPIVPRAQMLAELMRFRFGIAIAGTHGKTTTSSLIANIFANAGLDPSFVIGGRLNASGTHAQLGRGDYLITEADESDASFLHLTPMVAIVTNVDRDHMGTYEDSWDTLCETFQTFLQKLPFYGLAILCADDELLNEWAHTLPRPSRTYGFREGTDYQITGFQQLNLLSTFTLTRPKPHPPLTVRWEMPGRHNALNAAAAIAVATEEGIPDDLIVKGLQQFQGVARRFEVLPTNAFLGKHVTMIDDYGHHPTEISSTLAAIREVWPKQRVVHVFQPHRYSRLHDLFEGFARSLCASDVLILAPVYGCGEEPLPGYDSNSLLKQVQTLGHTNATVLSSLGQLGQALEPVLQDDDIVVFQGAGTIGKRVRSLVAHQDTAPAQAE